MHAMNFFFSDRYTLSPWYLIRMYYFSCRGKKHACHRSSRWIRGPRVRRRCNELWQSVLYNVDQKRFERLEEALPLQRRRGKATARTRQPE